MLASVVTNMYAMRVRHRWQHPRFRNASNSLTAKSLLGFLSENLAICGKSLSVFDFGKICMLPGKKGMRVTDCCSHETCCTFWLRKFFNGQSEHIKIWTRKSPIMQLQVRVDCNLWLYRPECGIVCMLFLFFISHYKQLEYSQRKIIMCISTSTNFAWCDQPLFSTALERQRKGREKTKKTQVHS